MSGLQDPANITPVELHFGKLNAAHPFRSSPLTGSLPYGSKGNFAITGQK